MVGYRWLYHLRVCTYRFLTAAPVRDYLFILAKPHSFYSLVGAVIIILVPYKFDNQYKLRRIENPLELLQRIPIKDHLSILVAWLEPIALSGLCYVILAGKPSSLLKVICSYL